MFYVKYQNGECSVKAEITDENVFTTCPQCGREIQVDLQEMFASGDFDLCGTAVFCAECSEGRPPRNDNV